MPAISSAKIVDSKSNWEITIRDLHGTTARYKDNVNKLNYQQTSGDCRFNSCTNTFIRTRMVGLCDSHKVHQHDLFLELHDPHHISIKPPIHIDIVDKLIEWAGSRNFDLLPLFQDISFNILGNIPDVSTLAGDTIHGGFSCPPLQSLVDEAVLIVDKHLPTFNNSSYQPLKMKEGLIPARILALTFVGLILCEEANRGDRWFNRMIRKEESLTEYLGGAMPIGYFAARMFPWGIEIGRAASKFIPGRRT